MKHITLLQFGLGLALVITMFAVRTIVVESTRAFKYERLAAAYQNELEAMYRTTGSGIDSAYRCQRRGSLR